MTTMRAATILNGEIEVREVSVPPPLGPGQVLVRVKSCGICGSDLSMRRDPDRFVRVSREGGNTLSVFDPSLPVVPGHEFAGVIEEVGAGVEGLVLGDRVAGLGIVTDQGKGKASIIGYSNAYPGGFAELIVVDATWVRRLPDGISFDTAALAEPLHVGEMHVQWSGYTAGDRALVIGAGTIGLGVVLALRERGCEDITVVEPSPRRRALASIMGSSRVAAPPTEGGPVAALRDSPSRLLAFECSGRAGALDELVRTLPRGSRIQVVASPFSEETFVPVIAQWHQLVINFGSGPLGDPYGTTLARLAAGRVDTDLLVTGHVDLEGVRQAFDDLRDPEQHVKILVHPSGSEEREATPSPTARTTKANR
ncbi:alcohol dehydrogenase catalytic domain-containing protein [Microbacterium resistens]|uniref:alcohol dehydrogenase catalytic domain-containing protein n=1 Tax=Microbacterium resistens TaxID=156977 RepID=UPI000A71BC53|nr:alcohol dehydrogenase catalytic domain-containing protein [Microbacterium resistens]